MMLSSSQEIELILGVFVVLLGALATVRSFWPCDPELLRKAMHVGMGLVAFLLPWLLVSNWSVVLLAGLLIAFLMGIRLARPLRQKLGGVIHDVGRESWGEICFALGVVGLFMLSHGEPLLYSISILTLVLADTAASLIGCHYGRWRYHVLGECKSVEGSLAFLMMAFLIGALGLALFSSLGIFDSLVVALAFALPATLVEAMAARGADNFFVPLATFFLIKFLLTIGQLELAGFLAATVVAVPVVFLFLYDRSHSGSGMGVESPVAKKEPPHRLDFSPGPPAGGLFRLRGIESPRWDFSETNPSRINQ